MLADITWLRVSDYAGKYLHQSVHFSMEFINMISAIFHLIPPIISAVKSELFRFSPGNGPVIADRINPVSNITLIVLVLSPNGHYLIFPNLLATWPSHLIHGNTRSPLSLR